MVITPFLSVVDWESTFVPVDVLKLAATFGGAGSAAGALFGAHEGAALDGLASGRVSSLRG